MSRRAVLLANDFPPLSGGISGYLYGLWSHLPRERTAVLAPRLPGAEAFDRTHDLRVHRRRMLLPLPFLLRKLALIALPLAHAPRVLRLERADVLHAGHVLTAGVVGLILKQRTGLPYAVYGYGADLLDYARYPGVDALRRRVLREAEAVVTISENSVRVVEALGVPRARIAKVLMGIDVNRFTPDADGGAVRRAHGLGDRPVVLTVGRLVARKGHDVVIRALSRVRDKRPDVAYLIAGSGPERPGLEQLAASLGLTEAVRFCGFVAEDALPDYYAAADCFILCSRQIGTDFEGAGNVTLEASASARPVIAGRSGGTDEHVIAGETGLLVDPTDPGCVADAIVALLEDREAARRMGGQGRALVEERFQWARTMAPIEALL